MNVAVKLFSVVSNVHYVLSHPLCFVYGCGLVERELSWDSDDLGSSYNFVAN